MKAQAQLMQRALAQGVVEADKLSERVQLMVQQTDRLTKMLNTLLDLSRVEAGRLELSLDPTDLSQLVRRAVVSVQALTSQHTLTVDAPVSVDGVWDAGRLEQVMQNLLTNAVKYSPEGGAITVHVDVVGDSHVQVTVADEGVGISAEELPHLFERFYRAAGTRKLEGTGLGLYICQGIVAAHRGRLWASSDGPGHGSTFAFSLPFVTNLSSG
jgi:signal transduction histidine kinase